MTLRSDNWKCLVTGGAGFIGSNLCERLLNEGAAVICVDNLLTGKRANIEHLLGEDGFTFLEQDITEPHIERADWASGVSHIFHMASPASPRDYQAYPVETMLVNSQGTLQVLRLALGTGARCLIASTSEVYGDPQVHPQSESYWGNVNPIGPRSCYDESKRFGESLATVFSREHDVDVVIVRIFNTYGPRMATFDGRAIPNFVTQALRDQPLTVYGDGAQTRSFCYVDDMVEGLIRAINAGDGASSGDVVNLGSTDEITLLALAKKVASLCSASKGIEFKPLPTDDPVRRRPDLLKATDWLNWAPSTPLSQGLSNTVAWFEKSLDADTTERLTI